MTEEDKRLVAESLGKTFEDSHLDHIRKNIERMKLQIRMNRRQQGYTFDPTLQVVEEEKEEN